jgi:cyclase
MLRRCALVLTLLTTAAAQIPAGKGYETVKVADGIYTFVAPEPYAPIVSGNSTVIIGDEGALVVDSGMYPSRAKAMIAEIRQWTDKPVRVLVNTHWHWDHLNGNRVYRETFPDITILSTETTRAARAREESRRNRQARQRHAAQRR